MNGNELEPFIWECPGHNLAPNKQACYNYTVSGIIRDCDRDSFCYRWINTIFSAVNRRRDNEVK